MNNKSRKAKGRYLQNIVRDKIIELYPVLTKEHIRCDDSDLRETKFSILYESDSFHFEG